MSTNISQEQIKMYRPNLHHRQLVECEDNCFDDQCLNCRNEIMSSDEEDEMSSTDVLNLPQLDFDQSYDSTDSERNDNSSDSDSFDNPMNSNSSDSNSSDSNSNVGNSTQEMNEVNRKSQKASRNIRTMDSRFNKICDGLKDEDKKLVQLYRQYKHCTQLLTVFEDFLISFEDTEPEFYFGNWFANIMLMKDRFKALNEHRNSEILIQSLNDRMELAYDEFTDRKKQLISHQNLSNLNRVLSELHLLQNRITSAEQELDDIVDYIAVQIQEQRNLIGNFVEVMFAICNSIQSTIAHHELQEQFNSFDRQNFLQQFLTTLSSIQII